MPGVLEDAGLAGITEDFCRLGQSLPLCRTWSAHAAAPAASLGIMPGLAAGLIIDPFSYENRGVYGGVYSPFSYENGGSFQIRLRRVTWDGTGYIEFIYCFTRYMEFLP